MPTTAIRPIAQLVADAWRAVRWAKTYGEASCPTCYDGEHLEELPADPRNPALLRYWCRACQRIVSDWSDTWLAPLKAPLARWAWLLLHDAEQPKVGPDYTARKIGVRHHLITSMREKLAAAPPEFLAEWRQAMRARGIMAAQLEPTVREAA